MATMTAQNVITKARFFLNDDDSTAERWGDEFMWPLVNDAVNEVTNLRPDALYDATGELITIVPATGPTSTLSIDDAWILPCAIFVAWLALNRQAGQTFNAKQVASLAAQFDKLIKG
jgi:hypothetical protein